MRQTTILVGVGMALILVVALPAVGLAAMDGGPQVQDRETLDTEVQTSGVQTTGAQANGTQENGTQTNETAPGERLSGALGVQEAELEGNLEQRAFGVSIVAANSTESQADVVAQQVGDIEQQLENLSERREELEQQREAGEISDGKYRAQMAKIVAASESAKQMANQTGEVADQLPAAMLEERGVNATAIQTLKDNAANLTGPEVSEIARDIGGPSAGKSPVGNGSVDVPDRPDQAGGNGTDGGRDDGDNGDDDDRGNDGDQGTDGDRGNDGDQGTDGETGEESDDDGGNDGNRGNAGSLTPG
jgi:hypothetical protein